MFGMLEKISADKGSKYFLIFFPEIGFRRYMYMQFGKLYLHETSNPIFLGKIKKNVTDLLFVELTPRVLKVIYH